MPLVYGTLPNFPFNNSVSVFASLQANILFHLVHPFVVREFLRQLRCRSNFRPGERSSALEGCLNLVPKLLVREHRRSTFSRAIPVRAFALRAYGRVLREVARYPFMLAALAAKTHNRNWHSRH